VERQEYVDKLLGVGRKVGELETRLLQLEAPKRGNERSMAKKVHGK
jgi:hypothetical protein